MKQPANVLTGFYLAGLLAWKDCVARFQHPIPLTFLIVVPLAMVTLTGLAFKGFEPRRLETTVALQDDDGGPIAQRLRAVLERELAGPADGAAGANQPGVHVRFLPLALDPTEARRRIASRELGGLIVLPAGTSRQLGEPGGEAVQVELVVGPKPTLERSAIEAAVDRVVDRVREQKPLPLAWHTVPEGEDPRLVEGFSSFSQAVAGNGVMFILFNCILIGGMALVHERDQHTLDRLMISPMSRRMIFLGKVLGVFLVGVFQALVVFGFGALLGVPMGSVLGVAVVTLLFILVGCAMALAISALARREEQVQDIGVPVALLMTALGGGMFPIEFAPTWMQYLALLFPTGWAMQAYHKLMWEGMSWTAVLPNLAVLAGFAVVFFLAGNRALRTV
jgi:ABC-type multidrug transport system permease subunit